jgi:FkbM family methyltransferase
VGVLTIGAHGHEYRIEDPGGLIGAPLRAGVPYEARVLEHIKRKGFDGTAVDVGAHVGNHALWLAVVCGLEVHAFEPRPDVCRQLRANVELNQAAVSVHELALGGKQGTAQHVGKGQLAPEGPIAVMPLDSFALPDVSLVKIDVEGMEAEVLDGARETIARWRPLLYVEARDAQAHRRIATVLEPLSYRHLKTFGATPLEEWVPQNDTAE